LEPLRSLLFVPANRERFLRKAQDLAPDALVPDLESGVLDPDKPKARQMLRDALPALAKRAKVFARVNAIDSPHLLDDLNAIISSDLTGVTLPQIESPDDIRRLDEMISNLEQGKGLPFGHVRIIAFIESALGVMRAFDIATASSRVVAIAFGAEDFTADMGVARSKEGAEVLFARNQVAVAARAAHKLAIDAPYVALDDPAGLEADVRLALRLGFKGKFAIHPSQIETINAVFSPSEQEVEQARRILKAFERAEAEGQGTYALDGKMIDTAIALRAQKLLRTADAIRQGRE
jgi:citrate lyase subunit beta/citryl-CoA lyase